MEERMKELFSELVPIEGKCETLAGELVRAASQIYYRYYNDGDYVNFGYGKEVCNPAARFLARYGNAEVVRIICMLWEEHEIDAYELLLNNLIDEVVNMIDNNQALREIPTEDMWDYSRPEDTDIEED